jgi:type III restriction enzyme
MTMKLQFSHQEHQAKAVAAVVTVFDGQALAQSDFTLAAAQGSVAYAGDGSIGNAVLLSDEQILSNVQTVQGVNGIPPSKALETSRSENGKETFCPLNFSIEMETGTGKTYAFIKTMYELNKVYGLR